MKYYVVQYHEKGDVPKYYGVVDYYHCQAENAAHAYKMCQETFPKVEITRIFMEV